MAIWFVACHHFYIWLINISIYWLFLSLGWLFNLLQECLIEKILPLLDKYYNFRIYSINYYTIKKNNIYTVQYLINAIILLFAILISTVKRVVNRILTLYRILSQKVYAIECGLLRLFRFACDLTGHTIRKSVRSSLKYTFYIRNVCPPWYLWSF